LLAVRHKEQSPSQQERGQSILNRVRWSQFKGHFREELKRFQVEARCGNR
jgi:uncharacterized protein YeaO (DUF488 family)